MRTLLELHPMEQINAVARGRFSPFDPTLISGEHDMFRFKPTPLHLSLRLAFVLVPAAAAAQENSAVELDKVVIESKATPAAAAQKKVDELPGGASVVDSEQTARGRNASLEDVLANQPGVFAQSVGNDSIKISIRGSGVISGAGVFREGVNFYYDGLYLTGAGGTPYELIGGQAANYTEVLRGANAFELGALTIGGGINFVTHSGRTAPGLRLRGEGGSFGFHKAQVSYGGTALDDRFDYFVYVDDVRSEGYRDWSLSKSHGEVVNLGWQLTPAFKAQFLLRQRWEFHQDPGSLTWAQLKDNPKQANASSKRSRSSGYRPGTTWAALKGFYTFEDNSELEFGIAWHDYPHENGRDGLSTYDRVNQTTVAGPGGNNGTPGLWDWHDLNIGAAYRRTDQIGGRESRTTLSFNQTRHLLASSKAMSGGRNGDVYKEVDYGGSHDTALSIGNETELFSGFWLSSGLTAVYIKRDTEYRSSWQDYNPNLPDKDSYTYHGLAPRLGFRWQTTPTVELFGNASRSVAPVLSWRYGGNITSNIGGITSSRAGVLPLTVQTGNSLEFGARVKNDIFDGSLILYNIWIHDEILTESVTLPGEATPTSITFNAATPTIHRGIEAALSARLWQPEQGGQQVVLRQVYTLNDFYYRNDPLYRSNKLPGLPRHVYSAELQYQHPNGFFAGLKARAFSRTPVDYTNSRYAPAATIWGASAGYEAPDKSWKAYLDLHNLANKKYVTAVSVQGDAKGADVAALLPGQGFGAFAGLEFRF
ncbi:MAG: TonB-dependent receptor [Zoogloeaceae bacterium]|nr:TonB-dependent receptor [Zoogloeaceae bacterium]